jgi:hypothetical protein
MQLGGFCGGAGRIWSFSRSFKPMRTHHLLVATLFVAALVSTASGAHFYAQPSVAFGEITDFKAVAGPSLALGLTFAEKHSVEVEGSRFDTEGRFDSEYKLEALPVLISYRYEFPISGKLSGTAGISVGFVRQEVEYTFPDYYAQYFGYGPAFYHYEATDEAFTGGFHAGVVYRLADHFALTLGAKALRMAESDVQARGTMLMVQLGLNCRF